MKTGNDDAQRNSHNAPIGEDVVLKVAKEVAVKFIEMGRITPATFDETFKNIHRTVADTVKKET